jgi:hemolysin activation/secretion protein
MMLRGNLARASTQLNHVLRLVWLLILVLMAPIVLGAVVPTPHFRVDRFEIQGSNPLSATDTKSVLTQFVGEYDGIDGLLAAADALNQTLAEKGFTFYKAVLPPQKIENGVVRLKIVELKVGKVAVVGNKHFTNANILASVPSLKPGETPNTREIARSLDLANQHPAKTVLLKFKEADTPGTVDATLNVKDQRPYQFFSVLNNIGTPESGRLRLSVGGQYSNLFNRDQKVTVSYTMSPDNFNNVTQVGANYQIPIYNKAGTLSFFYVHSDVNIGNVGGFFDISGAGDFLGATYIQLLKNIGNYSQDWQLSLQLKYFENAFNGQPHEVESSPISFQYDGAYRTENSRLSFYMALVKNTAIGGLNTDSAYFNSPRIGATNDWTLGRFGGTYTYFLPKDWMARAMFDAQVTGQPLIAGEQFGVGGANSVRGFEERAISGDTGYRASFEIWTPKLPLVYDIRLLTFFDTGNRTLNEPLPGEVKSDTISSAGIGLRWEWKDQIGVKVDWARSIAGINKPAGQGEQDSAKWDFNLYYRF